MEVAGVMSICCAKEVPAGSTNSGTEIAPTQPSLQIKCRARTVRILTAGFRLLPGSQPSGDSGLSLEFDRSRNLKVDFRNMPFGNYAELTDPKVMRALAHPARTAILAHLQDHRTATATECSEVPEESPSACSYHLRSLAQLGFVEEVPTGDGRERRWRSLICGYGIPKEAQDRPEVLAAI